MNGTADHMSHGRPIGPTPKYADVKRWHCGIANDLDRIGYRLRQSAISDESAAAKLRLLADRLEVSTVDGF